MDLVKFFSDLKALIIGAEKEIVPDTANRFTEADIQAAEKRGKDALFAENERLKKEKADAEAAVKAVEEKRRKTRLPRSVRPDVRTAT